MNQIKNIGSSENPKHNFQGNNTTPVKRNNSTEISISSTKKIKLDNTVWNTDGILIKKPVNESTKDEHTKKSFKKESVVKTLQNFPNQDGEVSGEKGKSAFNNIRNITIPSPSSPRNSEDIVVISSSAADYIVDKDCEKSIRNKPIPEASNTLLNTNITGRKEVNSKCSGQTETADVGILPLNQEINTNEFDVVMLSSIQEQKPIQQLSLSSDNSHSGSLSRVVASGGNIMRPSTVTYTRITTASTISAGLPQNATVLNRRNISPNLKNQQVMTTSKKLASEVTQTTAKVSIGNTTISVPLLKPLNSSQHVHQSNSGSSEIQKQSQANTQTSSQQLSSQTQINLSKILTTKQGYKGSHPTIVSLSQLQIKPVSTTKLVQTKVFGKKLPQLQCSVATNSQPNSGLVTIAVSKAKPNIALNQSSSKKLISKQIPEDYYIIMSI
uniref:Histone-lysine N-methyltransferase trr n=1 Tax=Bactrocera dorsalis TaxID=27457 RepID=A0A034VVM4_BACDO